MTSFSLWRICYWAGHAYCYGRTLHYVHTDTLPLLIHNDSLVFHKCREDDCYYWWSRCRVLWLTVVMHRWTRPSWSQRPMRRRRLKMKSWLRSTARNITWTLTVVIGFICIDKKEWDSIIICPREWMRLNGYFPFLLFDAEFLCGCMPVLMLARRIMCCITSI